MLLLIVVVLGALSLDATSASEGATTQESSLCSEVAHVSWQTDWSTASVAGAVVDVPGCDDGETVGIQLLTDEGDVPADGPLMDEAVAGAVAFDLQPLKQRIEPVTGVRVFLELTDEEVVFVHVRVERRFFNRGDNEQTGLAEKIDIQVPRGSEYDVDGAPDGYIEVDCSDVTEIGEDVIGQRSGTFPATASGRHVACFQK